jgi:hypothetical protein
MGAVRTNRNGISLKLLYSVEKLYQSQFEVLKKEDKSKARVAPMLEKLTNHLYYIPTRRTCSRQ